MHVDGLKEDEEEVEGDYSARHKSSIIIENVDQEIINPEPSTVKDDTFENCFNDDTISKKYTFQRKKFLKRMLKECRPACSPVQWKALR